MRGLDYTLQESKKDKFMYNKQELDTDFGLNWYSYRFRSYDPQLRRFTSVDPLAEKFADLTTFQFASNDPISKIELEGLEGVGVKSPQQTEKIKQALANKNYEEVMRIVAYGLQNQFVDDNGNVSNYINTTEPNARVSYNMPISMYKHLKTGNKIVFFGFTQKKDENGNIIAGEGTWSPIGEMTKVDFKNEVKKIKNRGSGQSEETFVDDKTFNELLAMAEDTAGEFKTPEEADGYSESSRGDGSGMENGLYVVSPQDPNTGHRTVKVKGRSTDGLYQTITTITYDKNWKPIHQQVDTTIWKK
jgi:RHS repeat-associated protein